MDQMEISLKRTPLENGLLRRVGKLEQQIADLTAAISNHGIHIRKCDFCGKVMRLDTITVNGPQLLGVNGDGVDGIALRDGNYTRYYCTEHLMEAYEDCVDWSERDNDRALYTIAAWLLRHTNKLTSPRTVALTNFPDIKERMLHLYP